MKAQTITKLRQVFLQDTMEIIQARRAILDKYDKGLTLTDAIGHSIKDCIDTFERKRRALKQVSVNKVTTGKFKTGVAALDEQLRLKTDKITSQIQTQKAQKVAAWGKVEEMLYHDIIHLFDINDQNGALVSFERLMMRASPTKEFRQFLQKNQGKLYEVYEKYFVSFDRIPVKLKNPEKCEIPAFNEKMVKSILDLGTGKRSVAQILVQTKYSPVETLATLSHLIRSGHLDLT